MSRLSWAPNDRLGPVLFQLKGLALGGTILNPGHLEEAIAKEVEICSLAECAASELHMA